ncbi:XkdW family protein [Mesobacillus jeotgali]|uniref:XkdW family protein n=1 Tax=Mesobacillus jeotgali TaxID=129985 RepID=UPI001CFE982A|nr:XkdW family protein [Mesobacillus jeotgali]
MIQSILKRCPNMTADQIELRDEGKGVFIHKWEGIDPEPTIEEVKSWHEEDMANYVPPLPPEEELKLVKKQQELMQAAIDDLIFSGGTL